MEPLKIKIVLSRKKDIDLKQFDISILIKRSKYKPFLKFDENLLNDDIGNGFDFAKTASAQTRSKHDLFTRKNAVYDIVAQTNRSTAKMEESTLTEVLLEGGVAKYEGTPYALNEVQDVIKKSVKLTNKD